MRDRIKSVKVIGSTDETKVGKIIRAMSPQTFKFIPHARDLNTYRAVQTHID
tara:strand:- start:79670 stop:79825 length:156 start_codon:yes stop_codon:yes gene_type:complete